MTILSLTNVTRTYRNGDTEIRALNGVSLEIGEGEFVAIMGQSGSGKSTLMNILGCLDRPTGGSYRVMGRDVATLNADALAALRRDSFGFIFQRYNLITTATAQENVEIPAMYAGLPKEARAARGHSLLERLGLGNRRHHRPSELSGGQQQRVAVARALMNDPPIILADEPTGALDSKSGEEVMALLHDLHREGRTIILITHDAQVAAHAERVIQIFDGRIMEDSISPSPLVGEGRGEGVSLYKPAKNLLTSHATLRTEILEATRMALRSLRVNLFRTVLTLLGIIIGVASVVTMMAVGEGSRQEVLDQIAAMGTNTLSIRPGAPGLRGTGETVTLTVEDGAAILALPNVEAVVPERYGRYTAVYGNIDYETTVTAVGASLPQVRDWPPLEGNFFTERDLAGYAPVAVLGQTVVKNLFPGGENPVGQYVLLRNVPFEVIGTMSPKGANSWGTDQDDTVFIPFTTGMVRLFGKSYANSMTVKVADVSRMPETEAAIFDLLKTRHRAEDFRIRNMAALLDTAMETQNTLTVLLGAVAAISLLVGGIGVMNIMLVNVTERTREIGIRMATGARMRDILLQFNTESAVVCAVGGVIGLFAGWAAGWVAAMFGVTVIFSLTPAVIAFTCAFLTGLLFGYLPARKAARLDPVVALASE